MPLPPQRHAGRQAQVRSGGTVCTAGSQIELHLPVSNGTGHFPVVPTAPGGPEIDPSRLHGKVEQAVCVSITASYHCPTIIITQKGRNSLSLCQRRKTPEAIDYRSEPGIVYRDPY